MVLPTVPRSTEKFYLETLEIWRMSIYGRLRACVARRLPLRRGGPSAEDGCLMTTRTYRPDRASSRREARSPVLASGEPLLWRECALYFAIAAAIDTFIGLHSFPSVLKGSLVNPDTYMRLDRLRDILAQHAPVDVVGRDAGGAGTVLHWSHLIDSMILLLAAPLSPVIGEDRALHAAALAFGPISIGLLVLAVVWALAPFTHRRWRWLAPLLAGISPAIVGFAVPGEVHHHIPVAAASVMTAGWALRSPLLGAPAGRVMGGWTAVAIWLTPESMPFTLAAYGGLGLFWLTHPENPLSGAALRWSGATFLFVIAAALAVDPPFAGYLSPQIERVSVVYLGLAAVLYLVSWTASRLDRQHLPQGRRSIIAILTAGVGFGLWFTAFPAVLAGPAGLLNKQDGRIFFGAISDMLPIRSPPAVGAFLMDGAIATIATAFFAIRERSPVWAFAALCATLTVLLGAWHRRFATYPEVVAVAMLPVVLSAFDLSLERRPGAAVITARLATVAAFLTFPLSLALGNLMAHQGPATAAGASCDPRTLQDVLAPYAGDIVLSDPSELPGAALLDQGPDGWLAVSSEYCCLPAAARRLAQRAIGDGAHHRARDRRVARPGLPTPGALIPRRRPAVGYPVGPTQRGRPAPLAHPTRYKSCLGFFPLPHQGTQLLSPSVSKASMRPPSL